MPKALIEERKEAYRIFNLSKLERIKMGITDVTSACAHLKVKLDTYYKYKKEWKAGEGEFNPQDYLNEKNQDAYEALLLACKKGSPAALRTFFDLKGDLITKREDKARFEFIPTERIRIATELRDELRREFKDTGNCLVCHRFKEVCDSLRLDTEPEHEHGGEVATLGLSARSD